MVRGEERKIRRAHTITGTEKRCFSFKRCLRGGILVDSRICLSVYLYTSGSKKAQYHKPTDPRSFIGQQLHHPMPSTVGAKMAESEEDEKAPLSCQNIHWVFFSRAKALTSPSLINTQSTYKNQIFHLPICSPFTA